MAAEEITSTSEAITAVIKTQRDLKNVIDALNSRGFRNSDVSVVMPVKDGRQELAFEKETKVFKGAILGQLSGLVLGIFFAWLTTTKQVPVPGAELVMDYPPWIIFSVFICFSLIIAGLIGGAIGLGIPEYVTRLCEKSIKGGSILIAVHVDNNIWRERAIEILKFYKAHDIVDNKNIV